MSAERLSNFSIFSPVLSYFFSTPCVVRREPCVLVHGSSAEGQAKRYETMVLAAT